MVRLLGRGPLNGRQARDVQGRIEGRSLWQEAPNGACLPVANAIVPYHKKFNSNKLCNMIVGHHSFNWEVVKNIPPTALLSQEVLLLQ